MLRLVSSLSILVLWAGGVFSAPDASAQADRLCFDAPGITNCVEGRFREYWEENGGLPVFGYPISPAGMQQTAQGTFETQYFERNRFELHPEQARPYDVLLGRLGDEQLLQQGREWGDFPRGQQTQRCRFFAETGHSICDQAAGIGFKSYWESYGLRIPGLDPVAQSLALFGLPLSEPAMETNADGDRVQTQWFERARLEWHPNNPDRFKVLLGLLGNEVTGNLVVNGNFEAPSVDGEYTTYRRGETFGGWTVASGSINHKSSLWQAADGRQSIDLNGNEAGALQQDIPTVPGQRYRLRFAMAGNADDRGPVRCGAGVKQMTVTWGDTTVATLAFDTAGRTATNIGWGYHEYSVITSSGQTRLSFRSETYGTACGPMIDQVSLRQATP